MFFQGVSFSQPAYKTEDILFPKTKNNNTDNFIFIKKLEVGNLSFDYKDSRKSKEENRNVNYLASAPRIYLNGYCLYSGIWTGFTVGGKTINPFYPYVLKNYYVVENNKDRIFVEQLWETDYGNFFIKIVEYRDMPQWIFGRIECEYPLTTIQFLGVVPLHAFQIEGREIWCVFNKSGPFKISAWTRFEQPSFQEGDFAVAIINKGVKDISLKTFKKFFVFNQDEIKNISFEFSPALRLIVTPKDTKSSMAYKFSFAVGYWFDRSDSSDEKQEKVVNEFLQSQSTEIRNKLNSINWIPDYKEWTNVERTLKEIEKYIEYPGVKDLLEKYNFDEIRKDFELAKKEKDYRKSIDIEDMLKIIKDAMYNVLIEEMKK
ncbi:MAG TPA: hypothetical protein PK303_05610 [bacterium]|nr:hypothetical protein [bacterium]